MMKAVIKQVLLLLLPPTTTTLCYCNWTASATTQEARSGWLKHCATSRKVVGSILDDIEMRRLLNPSGRTIALGSTQVLTEMRTRNISWRVKAAGA